MGSDLEGDAPRLVIPSETDAVEVRIGSGSALSLAAQVVGLGSSFIVGIVVARTLGVAGKGALSVIMQVPGILLIMLDLGIATATIRFVSRGELRAGTAAANSTLIAIALGLIGAPVVYLFLAGRLAVVPGVPALAVVAAMIVLPVGLLAAWLSGVSVGTGDLRLPLLYSLTSSSATLLGLVVLVATHNAGLGNIVMVSVAGTTVGVLVFFIGLRRRIRPFRPSLLAAKMTVGFSAKVYVSNVAGFMLERQDVLLLAWLSGARAVGLYSVAVSFAELAWYIPSALGTAIMAKGGRSDEASGADYVSRTTRVALVIMAATMVVSLVAVPFVIPLVYGRAFAPAMYAFFVLLPGILIDGVARILWSWETVRGRVYWRAALGAMALNVALVLVLAPKWGPIGTGLASTLAYGAIGAFIIRRFCLGTGTRLADVLVPHREDVDVIVRTVAQVFRAAMARFL